MSVFSSMIIDSKIASDAAARLDAVDTSTAA